MGMNSLATCVEVSEMYALEEQLIESHSRLMIEQLRAKEEMAKKEAQICSSNTTTKPSFWRCSAMSCARR